MILPTLAAAETPPAPFAIDGRPLKVLFLGNDDNYNFRMATWSREFGVEADLWIIQPLDPYRGDFHMLTPSGPPAWIRDMPLGDGRALAARPGEIGRAIDATYDFVGVAGPASLIASRGLRSPRGLCAIGAELGDLPFPFHPGYTLSQGRQTLRRKLSCAYHTRAALRRVDFIIDSYEAHTAKLRRLGLLDKRFFRGLSCDCRGDRALVRDDLRRQLLDRYRGAQRVFLWFSRLNFSDPMALIYKGAERYLKALESVLPELQSGKVRLVMGRHGNELDAFLRLVETSPVAAHIDWVDHLGARELMTYLALPNAVLFGEFGERLRELSGIGRDAASIGTVTVSSALPEITARQYGSPAPVLHAKTADEIAARMRELVSMTEDRFRDLQEGMKDYGAQAVDYHPMMPRFYELVQAAITRRRSVAP